MLALLQENEPDSDTPWICVGHPSGMPTPQVGNPCVIRTISTSQNGRLYV